MKILHITASYKPAFIYGGPIYSVAAMCEALVESGKSKVKSEGLETDMESERQETRDQKQEGSPESGVRSWEFGVKKKLPR